MHLQRPRALLALWMAAISIVASGRVLAESTVQFDADAHAALDVLVQGSPAAKALGEKAKAVLVFPDIVKAGFIFGAQGGDGVLLKKGKTAGYYNTAAVSYGLQAGVQTFGYALFFMSDEVLSKFENSEGWEIGVGPNIVVVDKGAAKDMTTLTAKADIYAFIFDQKGLMAGVGIKGSKITKIKSP